MDGVEQINKLIELGYDIAFNIGRIDKVSFEQLYEICKILSKTKIKYFIMADTYGSVDEHYIEKLIPYVSNLFKNEFKNDNIKIGFHAHDNCSNATSKALHSIKYGTNIIDGCSLGFGRGSGNAKIELLMMYLNKNYNYNFDFIHNIDFGDTYLINYKECHNNLSYNVVYALCSYFGCHVTYAIELIENYKKVNIKQIYNLLLKLKEINKHMFYNEKLLKDFFES
jgi:4-hydroxy 2-oxovalerate aldolase